ncbi:DnaD domain protein [Desulfitobacterium metallireducens]|uniref:DnaB/C C-terminal domain-containing protein n=1 Tax=Desulfitobacterium metallireducens DSM 15288 TaxID=871968 RepID=W0EHD1_9FIRM|nr:DnaD domain protein [Desulfitobacterium metallireducens]AHF08619.1 hypothetical protein DESME_09730 [Desulfitobacterium metallireducens DSM 15288]
MAGWIKLWRKLIDNGHLKMPGTAFKLWIYCLLEAAPYPDLKRNLAIGELWLSYQSIRENLGEVDKKVSNSTVSAALKYLEQHGYLTLQSQRFKGIKAKVVNWSEYQALTYASSELTTTQEATETSSPLPPPPVDDCTVKNRLTPPARAENETEQKRSTPFPRTKIHEIRNQPTPLTGVDTSSSSRRTSTPTVAHNSSQSSRPTTPTGVVSNPQPYNTKASSTDKNSINNDKENNIKNINVVVKVAADFANEFGRPLSPNEIKQLVYWQKSFSEDLIKEALSLASLQDKHTLAYVGGILKNWSRSGLTSIEEVKREQAKPRSKRSPEGRKRNVQAKPGYHPDEVDWANEPNTL